jgi:hypothetical protein
MADTTTTLDTGTPQDPGRKPFWRRRWVRVTGGLTAVVIAAIAVGSATNHPNAVAPKPKSAPAASAPTARSYADVQSLLAEMVVHGAVCTHPVFRTSGAMNLTPGALDPSVGCDGASAGDTAVVVFTSHADAVAYAASMIGVGQSIGDPAAEVVGPDWVVNTVPAFADKVVKAVGGQLMTEPSTAPKQTAPAAPAQTPAQQTPVSQAPAPAPSTAAPAAQAPSTAPAAPAAPAMTASQQQAVDAAQGYLSMGSGFSYNSLIQQLTSSAGNGFPQADAVFAINYLHPDWDAQAVEAAKGYMNMGSGFSRDSLIQQLTSQYGNGFTYDQAVYAANQVGL